MRHIQTAPQIMFRAKIMLEDLSLRLRLWPLTYRHTLHGHLHSTVLAVHFRAKEQKEMGSDLDRPPSRLHRVHLFGRGYSTATVRGGPVSLIHHEHRPYLPPDRFSVQEAIIDYVTMVGCRHEDIRGR